MTHPSSLNAGPEATPMGGKPPSNKKTRDLSTLRVTRAYSGGEARSGGSGKFRG